jgi:sugar phosphate isomerase/epimerase
VARSANEVIGALGRRLGKDFSPAADLDTVLGDGTVSFRAPICVLAAKGYRDWLVIAQIRSWNNQKPIGKSARAGRLKSAVTPSSLPPGDTMSA